MEYLIIVIMASNVLGLNMGFFLLSLACIFVYMVNRSQLNIIILHYPTIWVLGIFGIFYALLSNMPNGIRDYVITPFLTFYAGWILMCIPHEKKQSDLKKIFFSILIGFAIHSLFNVFNNSESGRTEVIDVFNGLLLSATCAGGINTLSFSLLMYFIIEKNRKLKITGFVCFAISFWYATILASRTQFIILVIVFVVMACLYLREQKNSKALLRFWGGLILFAACIFIVYYFSIFSFKTSLMPS